jgi:branched-chain amino acid transport system substrate-binding protein
MKTTRIVWSVVAVLAMCASWHANAADTCGLSNGKAATGNPIQVGAVVGKMGPKTR